MAPARNAPYPWLMDETPTYLVRGTLRGDRIVAGPLEADEAVEHCFGMRDAGYADITVTNLLTGHVSELEDWAKGTGV